MMAAHNLRGMRFVSVLAGLGLLIALSGCSGGEDSPEGSGGSPQQTAESVTDSIAAEIGVEQVEITEDNDPNDLIGRPNGYVAAVVLKDPRAECADGIGIECGATVEEWPDADAAEARADYISTLQADSPFLGSEYHYLVGPVLVRVTGELKPSEAEEYESAVNS